MIGTSTAAIRFGGLAAIAAITAGLAPSSSWRRTAWGSISSCGTSSDSRAVATTKNLVSTELPTYGLREELVCVSKENATQTEGSPSGKTLSTRQHPLIGHGCLTG